MGFMELLWSLGLIVFLLVALNHMAGGRASNVLRPVSNIASGLVSFAFRLCMSPAKLAEKFLLIDLRRLI